MKQAIMNTPFTAVQWHGEDYPYYENDAELNEFKVGDEVLVLHEAERNPMTRLFVVFNPRNNQSAVITEKYFDCVGE